MDMNHEPLNASSSNIRNPNSQMMDQQLFVLNKLTFDPLNFNCYLQSNLNGQFELIASRDLLPNEEMTCWFSESYLKNIKSKFTFNSNRLKFDTISVWLIFVQNS